VVKLSPLFLVAILVCPAVWCQEVGPSAVDIVEEPHHTLILKNQAVRVFRLRLQPKEVTLPHRHKTFYAFLSLRPLTLGNEVRGRQPILTELKAGELHTSKGGFAVAERNMSAEPAEVLVIESIKADDGKSFGTPMGGFQLHNAALIMLFESSVARAYTMAIAAGGRVGVHSEDYDRLLVALTDLSLREEVDGQPPSHLEMKAGEVRWVARGMPHSTTNAGDCPAALLTFEFR
jgi:quercetin dioxygenase-like cupin family protein